ncbi:MAG: heme o synthase [Magnetospiraceae bacterium]
MTLRAYISLFKPRIAMMIALTALVGYAAMAPTVEPLAALALVLAMVLGSSSSAIFNHFYDRDIDAQMARTANRPLASGQVEKPESLLWLAAAMLAAGCFLALAAFNWAVALHLFLGAFVYGIVYTVWLKRRTSMNIVIGGAAGSFAILAGAAAYDPTQWLLPLAMAVTLFLWTPSHFWALAMLLKDDYEKAGVPMLPVLVGNATCARWVFANSVLLVGSTAVPLMMGALGATYGVIAALFGARFMWENLRLVRDPSRDNARKAFFGSMVYLMGVFVAILADRHLGPALF